MGELTADRPQNQPAFVQSTEIFQKTDSMLYKFDLIRYNLS